MGTWMEKFTLLLVTPICHFSVSLSHSVVNFQVNADGPCIKTLPITRQESYLDHVRISEDYDECASELGNQRKHGGGQMLELARSCVMMPGVIQHEFMHALGIQHEQTR